MCVCVCVCVRASLDVVAIEKGAFGLPSTKVSNLTYFLLIYICVCKVQILINLETNRGNIVLI